MWRGLTMRQCGGVEVCTCFVRLHTILGVSHCPIMSKQFVVREKLPLLDVCSCKEAHALAWHIPHFDLASNKVVVDCCHSV